MPSSTPATAPMATAMTPTVIDVRAPAITRARTSRPYWSVPKGWALDGACRRATIDMASGSVGVHARLTTATVISASVSSTPSVKVTCRQGRRLLMAETRIERAVRQVHQEVDRDDAGRDEERDALHHRQVARGDGAEGQAAEARKHEHRLEDDAAGEELADLEAGDRHDGDQRVARTRTAAWNTPSAIAGRMSDLHPLKPPVCAEPRCTEKARISSKPAQNDGTEMPSWEMTIVT